MLLAKPVLGKVRIYNPHPADSHDTFMYNMSASCSCMYALDRLWQHVTSAIMDRDQLRATQEKFVLEEAQRREARERGDKSWTPRLFHQDPVTSEWTYRHMEYEHTHTEQMCRLFSLDFRSV